MNLKYLDHTELYSKIFVVHNTNIEIMQLYFVSKMYLIDIIRVIGFYHKQGFFIPPPPHLSGRFCKKSEKSGKIGNI